MKKAIIIGAGPAGLTAAYYLLKETDICPIVFESDTQVGGISKTVNVEGDRIDIGGHRFFTQNEKIMSLWKELMPVQGQMAYDDKKLSRSCELSPNGPDPEKEDVVLLNRRRISRIFYLKKFFDYPVSLNWDTISNLGSKRMFEIMVSYLKSSISKLPEHNLEDFMINRFGRKLYETFFRDYTEKVWGRSPKDIDADWGSQRIRGVSLKKTIMHFLRQSLGLNGKTETSFINQFLYPKYGPGQMWEHMRDEIVSMGGKIYMENKVTSINLSGDHISSVTVENDGIQEVFQADYVFSSMPIVDLIRALPESDVPGQVRKVAESLPYRDFMTVGILVDQMELKNSTQIPTLRNIVPDCWIYIQEPHVKVGRLQIFNNWSPYMVAQPEKMVWIGMEYFCQEGDELWNMSDSDFIDFAIEEMEKLGIISRSHVQKTVRLKVKKAYPAYFGTYAQFSLVKDYLSNIKNLYCIGRNGQHRYNNMDHSMLTAIEAVREIKNGTESKEALWSINSDQNYQEAGK